MTRCATITIRRIGAVCALTLFAEAVHAESRFETTPTSDTKATAQLDFIIVIPEVVYLGSAKAATGRDLPQPLTMQRTDGSKSGEPYVVLTNAGTLVFAPTQLAPAQTWQVGARGAAPESSPIRVYLVAMP